MARLGRQVFFLREVPSCFRFFSKLLKKITRSLMDVFIKRSLSINREKSFSFVLILIGLLSISSKPKYLDDFIFCFHQEFNLHTEWWRRDKTIFTKFRNKGSLSQSSFSRNKTVSYINLCFERENSLNYSRKFAGKA